jgi:hypothetical protein
MNPNITWKIVQENPDKPWDWYFMSSNTFGYVPTEEIKKLKANEIADMCREHIMKFCWNPEKELGRYLVLQEAELNEYNDD